MNEPDAQPKSRRRWWIAAAAVIVLAFVGWKILERALDVEQYHPLLEKELARITGQPVSIGRLDLAWRPIPCLSILDVSIGSGDFAVTSERIDVFPAFHALLSQRIEIPRITLDALAVTLPETSEDLKRSFDETLSHVEAALASDEGDTPSEWSVEVSTVRAGDAVLRRGADATPRLLANVTVRGVTSDAISLELESEAPGMVRSNLEAEISLPGEADDATRIALTGDFAFERVRAAQGRVKGSARLGGAAPGSATLEVEGEGLVLRGGAELGESSVLRVESLVADGPALATLLEMLVAPPLRITPGSDASFEVRDLVVALSGDAGPQLRSGRFETRALEFVWNEETLAPDLRAVARFADGALLIEELTGGPLVLRGRITPDADWGHAELALSGSLRLDDAWLHALGAPASLRDAKGTLQIDALSGIVPPAPERAPLAVNASLSGGSLRLVTDEEEELISDLALRLATAERRIDVQGSARSGRLGPVSLSAIVEPDAGSVRGNAGFDAKALAAFVSDPELRTQLAPLLRSYGPSVLAFQLAPVEGSPDTQRLVLQRVEAPRIDASLALVSGGAETLGDIEATAALPAGALLGVLPEGASATGDLRLSLKRTAAKQSFSVTADLAPLGLATGNFVEKKVGEALTLRVAGKTGADGWTPRTLELAAANAKLPFTFGKDGLVAPELDLDLADWSFLLVDTARASGRIRGSADLPAKALDLQLAGVGLRFSEDVGVDAIDGAVIRRGDDWNVRELRIRGDRSDATLTASLSGGRVEGQLAGANLDLDFVQALIAEVNALRPSDAEPEESKPIAGKLDVRLERMGYGRGEVKNLLAEIAMQTGDVSVRNLAFDTYEGNVSGTVDVKSRGADPSLLALDLDIANVTGRFLDDVFFDPPRGTKGRFSGKLRFEAPLLGDAKAMLAASNGTFTATGQEGSFGKGGIATKLVTVLRSTETLRLKLPTLSDEGLVFDSTTADFTMESGRLTVKNFVLDSKSYAISAKGEIDFAKDESNIPIEVNAIKGLTGLVAWIPVAGKALEMVNVRLVATGSPFDMKVGVASITDQILGAGAAGAGAVIKDVGDALRLLRGLGGGGAATPSETAEGVPGKGAPAGAEPGEAGTVEAKATPEAQPAEVAPAREVGTEEGETAGTATVEDATAKDATVKDATAEGAPASKDAPAPVGTSDAVEPASPAAAGPTPAATEPATPEPAAAEPATPEPAAPERAAQPGSPPLATPPDAAAKESGEPERAGPGGV